MPPHPARNEPTPAAPKGDPDTQYYRRTLHEMIDLGADLARLVHQQAHEQAKAQPDPSPASNDNRRPTTDLTVAFDRIVRAIRRTILLAQSLDAPPRPHPATRAAARKRTIRAVEDAIHREDLPPTRAQTLHAELLDRLDAPELEDDLAIRPIADIITEIRKDLGLNGTPGFAPFKRRTPADLATLHARATAPPWPPGTGQPGRTQPATAPTTTGPAASWNSASLTP